MNDNQQNGIVIQKKHIVIAFVIFLLILIGGIVTAFNWNTWFGKEDSAPVSEQMQNDAPAPELDLDPNAGAWNGQQPEDKGGEEVGIKIPGYPSITIPADTETVTVALLNPEGNPCYFTFELVLNDTEETLYQSKLVPPGDAITEITMSRPLPAGEYDATIKISTLSLDGTSALNGANVETVLIAK